MIYQSEKEARSSGLIRAVLKGIVGAVFVYGTVWLAFLFGHAVGL